MKTNKKYTREIRKQLGYFATWLPSTPISLGDIGIFRQHVFTKISNLSDKGIQFEIEKDDATAEISYNSAGAVSLTTKASGQLIEGSTLGEMEMGISIAFSKSNSIVFKANGTTNPTIKDQIALGTNIKQLFKEGKWDKNWAVVTELVEAESCSVIISSSRKGKIDLKATSDININELDVANAKAEFQLSFSKDLSTQIVAKDGMTPLFKASSLKSKLFSTPKFGLMKASSIDMITPAEVVNNDSAVYFGETTIEDLENS